MSLSIKQSTSDDNIEEIVKRLVSLASPVKIILFGSNATDTATPGSDLDLLVTFEAGARLSLWDIIAAEQELAELLGRPVDLVEKCAVENSENWIRKHHILQSAHVVYAR